MRGAWLAAIFSVLFAHNAMADVTAQAPGAKLADGKYNNCAAKYYPPTAIRLNHEGSTVVTVSIDDKGGVSGALVTQASGFPDLDQAAVDCVTKEWHFTPATENGKPVASSKKYRIVWKLTGGDVPPWLKMDSDGLCNPIFASAKARWPTYRSAVLQFRVSPTGTVELPFAAISSGDALFDAKAVECMSKLTYTPAQINGAVAEVSWNAAVLWSPHTGLAFADGKDEGYYCPDSDFPASMWHGDPPNPTDISFQTLFRSFAANFAIENESGNPELDQAALQCLKAHLLPAPALQQGPMSYGVLVRFNWRLGHAYILTQPVN